MVKFFSNKKGQAAIADAFFFLLIVGTIAVFIFYFTSQYGIKTDKNLRDEYIFEYTTSAIKSFYYDTTVRSGKKDYLLAFVKEDFLSDQKLNWARAESGSKACMLKELKKLMYPLEGAYDYMFYIYDPGEGQATTFRTANFHYMIFKTFERNGQNVEKVYYECSVEKGSGLENEKSQSVVLSNLYSVLGNVSEQFGADGVLALTYTIGGEPQDIYVNTSLKLWSAGALPIELVSQLDCVKITEEQSQQCN